MFPKLAIASLAGLASGHIVKRDGGSHHHDHSQPEAGYAAPSPASYAAPSYSAPAPNYSPPAPSYAAPSPSYAAPSPAYSAPEPAYGAPEAAYGAPAASYDAPAPAYGAPEASYSAPASGYGYGATEESGGLDLTSIFIPLLALLGLSLLFPTYVSLATVRKRRAAGEEDESSGNSVVERVQDIYMSVLESEECMERVACEVGGLAADAGLSPKMLSMATPFVPQKYSKMMKTFSTGKDCHKIKCGKIF